MKYCNWGTTCQIYFKHW